MVTVITFYTPELYLSLKRAYKNDDVTSLKSAGQSSVGVELFLTQWGIVLLM